MLSKNIIANSATQSARRGTRRALDNIANKVSTSRKRKRFTARNRLRGITSVKRVRTCGLALGYDRAFVHVERDEYGRVHFRGLETCRRVWLCPVCAPRISAKRAELLEAEIAAWMLGGGTVWFLTLTFPHDYQDRLTSTAALAAKAFTAVLRGRAAEEDRSRYDVAGFVRALEVTTGENGWHPHLHVLVFLDRWRGKRAMRELQYSIVSRFSAFVVREGFRAPNIRNCPIEVVATADVGKYVAKANGTAREMTSGHLKDGRGNNRTPMQLLAAALDGDETARRRWAEYETGMHGRRQLTYTPKLRKRLKAMLEQEAEPNPLTDALARLAREGVAIDPRLWYRMSEVDGLDLDMLEAFESGGYDAALATVQHGLGEFVSREVIKARFRRLGLPVQVESNSCNAAT